MEAFRGPTYAPNLAENNALAIPATMTTNRQETFQIPIAVHRWFRQGEGWAYHPELNMSLIHRLAASLLRDRTRLWPEGERINQEARQGAFESPESNSFPTDSININGEPDDKSKIANDVSAPSPERAALSEFGVVSEKQERFAYLHYADLECPDPKAQGRFPTVLIIARIMDLPVDQLRFDQLRTWVNQHMPDCPGPHSSLLWIYKSHISQAACVTLPESSLPPSQHTKVAPSRGTPGNWPPILSAFGTMLLAIVISIALWYSRSQLTTSETDSLVDAKYHPTNKDQGGETKLPQPLAEPTKPSNLAKPGSLGSKPIVPEKSRLYAVAKEMYECLKQWNKHGQLSEILGIASAEIEVNAPLPNRTPANDQDANCVIRRFFYVLSRKPVQHLLTDDVRKKTWEGKFLLLLPEDPPEPALNGSYSYMSEDKLYNDLVQLHGRILGQTNLTNGVSRDSSNHSNSLLDIQRIWQPKAAASPEYFIAIAKIRSEFSFSKWQHKLHQQLPHIARDLENCNDERLSRWVRDFK